MLILQASINVITPYFYKTLSEFAIIELCQILLKFVADFVNER